MVVRLSAAIRGADRINLFLCGNGSDPKFVLFIPMLPMAPRPLPCLQINSTEADRVHRRERR